MLSKHFLKVFLIFFTIISTAASTSGKIECAPPTSGVNPLSFSACRLAVVEFIKRHPAGVFDEYYLTRKKTVGRHYIQCPYVIEDEGCVFTLDYRKPFRSFAQLELRPDRTGEAAMKLARECVRQEGVDGGKTTWSGFGWKIKVALAHTEMPYSGPGPGPGPYANLSSIGDENETVVINQRW